MNLRKRGKQEENHVGIFRFQLTLAHIFHVVSFRLFYCCVLHSLFLLPATGTVSSKWDAQGWRCNPRWAVWDSLLFCLSWFVFYLWATTADLPRVSLSGKQQKTETGENQFHSYNWFLMIRCCSERITLYIHAILNKCFNKRWYSAGLIAESVTV